MQIADYFVGKEVFVANIVILLEFKLFFRLFWEEKFILLDIYYFSFLSKEKILK